MAHLIVESTHAAPLTDEERSRMGSRLEPCLKQYGARWIRTYISLDRRRMVCEFEAPDAESLRSSLRSAGLPFDRVWVAELNERQPDATTAVNT